MFYKKKIAFKRVENILFEKLEQYEIYVRDFVIIFKKIK